MGFTQIYVAVITVAAWGMIILGTAYLLVRWRWPHLLEVEPAPDERVSPYAEDEPHDYVTSGPAPFADRAADPGPSAGPSALSVPGIEYWESLTLDRSRAVLIAALVAAGWKTGEIRAVLKGANDVTGKEVEAERQRQGLASEDVRLVPIAGGREGYIKL